MEKMTMDVTGKAKRRRTRQMKYQRGMTMICPEHGVARGCSGKSNPWLGGHTSIFHQRDVHDAVSRLSRQMKRSLDAGLKGHRPVLISDSPSWYRDSSPSIPRVIVSRWVFTVVSGGVIRTGTSSRDGEEEDIISSGQVSPICKSLLFHINEH